MGKYFCFFIGFFLLTQSVFARDITIKLHSGTVKSNIERVAAANGWSKVIWRTKNNYAWVGKTVIVASSFKEALAKALADYPLQAVFYENNHVLVIEPRTLK